MITKPEEHAWPCQNEYAESPGESRQRTETFHNSAPILQGSGGAVTSVCVCLSLQKTKKKAIIIIIGHPGAIFPSVSLSLTHARTHTCTHSQVTLVLKAVCNHLWIIPSVCMCVCLCVGVCVCVCVGVGVCACACVCVCRHFWHNCYHTYGVWVCIWCVNVYVCIILSLFLG